jgi:hypothetical protein
MAEFRCKPSKEFSTMITRPGVLNFKLSFPGGGRNAQIPSAIRRKMGGCDPTRVTFTLIGPQKHANSTAMAPGASGARASPGGRRPPPCV